MTETTSKSAKILNVYPLQPIQMDLELADTQEAVSTIYFLNQVTGQVFDFEGPTDENVQNAVHQWLTKKNEEARSRLATATPEQLKAMGIDVNSVPNNKKKIIV